MAELIQGPIPGQSLTDLPKNAPWEKPSEIVEVGDVVKHYIERLADDDIMDDLTVVFKLGGDLKTITETIMMTGSMNGVHTVEAGMLAGPIVAKFIKIAMESYGIDAPETNVSPEEKSKAKEFARVMALVNQAREQEGSTEGDPGMELLSDMGSAIESMPDVPAEATEGEEPMPMEEEMPMEPMESDTGEGLMSRGVS
tara:strand:+ start:52 stop:645 length:594 start_codon:yes stop_codon:yes gene_type:complete